MPRTFRLDGSRRLGARGDGSPWKSFPYAEEEDYRIIVQAISARLKPTLDAALEAAPSRWRCQSKTWCACRGMRLTGSSATARRNFAKPSSKPLRTRQSRWMPNPSPM